MYERPSHKKGNEGWVSELASVSPPYDYKKEHSSPRREYPALAYVVFARQEERAAAHCNKQQRGTEQG